MSKTKRELEAENSELKQKLEEIHEDLSEYLGVEDEDGADE